MAAARSPADKSKAKPVVKVGDSQTAAKAGTKKSPDKKASEKKETRDFDGRNYVLEHGLTALRILPHLSSAS